MKRALRMGNVSANRSRVVQRRKKGCSRPLLPAHGSSAGKSLLPDTAQTLLQAARGSGYGTFKERDGIIEQGSMDTTTAITGYHSTHQARPDYSDLRPVWEAPATAKRAAQAVACCAPPNSAY